jgi:hypothetical protein
MGDELFAPGGGIRNLSVTIPNGGSQSDVIDMDRYRFFGMQFPPAMTGTLITFLAGAGPGVADTFANAKAALAGGGFRQVYGDDGSIIQVTVVVDNCVGIGAPLMSKLAGFRYLALKSNQTEAAARHIGISIR